MLELINFDYGYQRPIFAFILNCPRVHTKELIVRMNTDKFARDRLNIRAAALLISSNPSDLNR